MIMGIYDNLYANLVGRANLWQEAVSEVTDDRPLRAGFPLAGKVPFAAGV